MAIKRKDLVRQLYLMNLQNIFNTLNTTFDGLDLFGRDINLNFDLCPDFPIPGMPPVNPQTLRTYLLTLVNKEVTVTTPTDSVTGTLMAVNNDYIVVLEHDGSMVHVQMSHILIVNAI